MPACTPPSFDERFREIKNLMTPEQKAPLAAAAGAWHAFARARAEAWGHAPKLPKGSEPKGITPLRPASRFARAQARSKEEAQGQVDGSEVQAGAGPMAGASAGAGAAAGAEASGAAVVVAAGDSPAAGLNGGTPGPSSAGPSSQAAQAVASTSQGRQGRQQPGRGTHGQHGQQQPRAPAAPQGPEPLKTLNVLHLCSGAGGMSLETHVPELGVRIRDRWAVDIDHNAVITHRINHKHCHVGVGWCLGEGCGAGAEGLGTPTQCRLCSLSCTAYRTCLPLKGLVHINQRGTGCQLSDGGTHTPVSSDSTLPYGPALHANASGPLHVHGAIPLPHAQGS